MSSEELEAELARLSKSARRTVRRVARRIADGAESPADALRHAESFARGDAGPWLELIRAEFAAGRVSWQPAYLPLLADLVAAELARREAELDELRRLVHLDLQRRRDEEALILLMASI